MNGRKTAKFGGSFNDLETLYVSYLTKIRQAAGKRQKLSLLSRSVVDEY